jgi:hypothetical protein
MHLMHLVKSSKYLIDLFQELVELINSHHFVVRSAREHVFFLAIFVEPCNSYGAIVTYKEVTAAEDQAYKALCAEHSADQR